MVQASPGEVEPTLGTRNKLVQTVTIRPPMSSRLPDSVRITALTACPKPAPKKKTPRTSAPATNRHLTHAESAMASRHRIAIQIQDERRILAAIHPFSA